MSKAPYTAQMAPATHATTAASDPPARWRALAILSMAMLLAMTTWFSASAVVPQLQQAWHLPATDGSLLTIAVQLGFVAGALASAMTALADIVRPTRLILIGSVLAAVANVSLLGVSSLVPALALRALTGAALALVYPPALKAIATWFRRGRGVALGAMVGALTLGSATPQLLRALGGIGWHFVIVATSALTIGGGLLAAIAGTEGPFPFARGRFDPRQAHAAFSNRAVRLSTLGYFGHMWELYAMWAWFATFFAAVLAQHRSGNVAVNAAWAAFAAIGVGTLGCIVGGILGDRWGRTKLTVLAMACSGSSAVAIGLAHRAPIPIVLGIGLFWGFWVVADSAQFSAIVTESAPGELVGTALTLQLAAGFVLTVATIYLVPVLQGAFGWTWAFAFLAPGPVIGIVAMWRLAHAPGGPVTATSGS